MLVLIFIQLKYYAQIGHKLIFIELYENWS